MKPNFFDRDAPVAEVQAYIDDLGYADVVGSLRRVAA